MQPVTPSATDVSVPFFVYDSTTFLPYTGLTAATSGLALAYRKGATGAETAITEVNLSAVTDAHSDGGLKHVRGAEYRLDLPDAAVPTAEHEVTTYGGTATGYVILGGALVGKPAEVVSGSLVAASVSGAVGSVTGHTPQTGDSFARIGAAGAGLTAVGDTAGTTTLLSRITALLQTKAEADTAHGLLATSASLTAAIALIADAVWDELLSGHATAGTAGHYLTDAGAAADPMMNDPADYTSGQLGYLIGRLAGGRIVVRGTTTPTGDMAEIVGGADYSATDGYSFDWTDADSEIAWPALTSATVTWHGLSPDGQTTSFSMTVVTPTGTKVVRLALTAAQTAALVALQTGLWTFTVWATLTSGRIRPLVRGTVPVVELVGP